MHEVAWIAVGIALALAATRLWRLYGRDEEAAAAGEETAAAGTQMAAAASESRRMALTLAEELANLVSGVEGRAHHLIEAAPNRAQLPNAAEAMLAAVQRLRTLHTKLVAFGHGRAVEPGTTDVEALIESLGDELQQMQLGLELRWDPPPNLPRVDASPSAVRDALLFVCAALLRVERGATRLSFAVERCFASERPRVQIELTLEWITDAGAVDAGAPADAAFALDLEAADHLIKSHGGDIALSHLPGRSVRAVVRWPMADTTLTETLIGPQLSRLAAVALAAADAPPAEGGDAAEAVLAEPLVELHGPGLVPPCAATAADAAGEPAGGAPPDQPFGHGYGGALVLESDPALRAVLARELKASGRAVFACADGVSARAFLEATPDRFEVLIVDDPLRLDAQTQLARTIRALVPDLKIFVLTPTPSDLSRAWPQLHVLQKPFGMHELRRALASVLATR